VLARILALTTLACTITVMGASAASADECSQAARTSAECPSISSDVTEEGVTFGATGTTQGSPGSEPQGGSSSVLSPAPRPSLPWSLPPPRSPVLGTTECAYLLQGSCRGSSPAKNPPPPTPTPSTAGVLPTPPSTVNDLASFQPDSSSIQVEPGWWTLPRLHTNVFSTAREHQVAGELLGVPIEVRFSPRAYAWSFGDGYTATTGSAGSSWGSEQFSPTATSHVYRAPGGYSLRLTVSYSVSYRYTGSSFTPVSGTVNQPVGPATVSVLRVTPVLVDHGCSVSILREGRC